MPYKVHDLMGLGAGQKTFSDDVLKIEICGPKRDHLSVVDVPGIFKKVTEGVTTNNRYRHGTQCGHILYEEPKIRNPRCHTSKCRHRDAGDPRHGSRM